VTVHLTCGGCKAELSIDDASELATAGLIKLWLGVHACVEVEE